MRYHRVAMVMHPMKYAPYRRERSTERRPGERGMMNRLSRLRGGCHRHERPTLICRVLREVYTTAYPRTRPSPLTSHRSFFHKPLCFFAARCALPATDHLSSLLPARRGKEPPRRFQQTLPLNPLAHRDVNPGISALPSRATSFLLAEVALRELRARFVP